MKILHFYSQLWLSRPRNEVFKFFSNALNLEEITPTWLQFHVVSAPPDPMYEGAEIEYRLRIRGFPVRWRSRITAWNPPHRFVDEQVRGPYRLWVHEHIFTEDSGGTSCEDHVQYFPVGGAFVNKLFVERDIQKIFAYRSDRLRGIFREGSIEVERAAHAERPGKNGWNAFSGTRPEREGVSENTKPF